MHPATTRKETHATNRITTIIAIPLLLALVSACSHQPKTADAGVMRWLPNGNDREALTVNRDHDLPAAKAGDVLAAPAEFDRQPMVVHGLVADVQLRELPRDMTALVVLIHDPSSAPRLAPPAPVVPDQLNLATPLAPVAEDLLLAAPAIDRNNLDRETLRQHYFDLKSTGSRVKALGNYLSGNGATDLAAGAARLAAGLQTFADGYQAVADLPPATGGPQPALLEAPATELVAPVEPTQFDRHLKATAELLRDLAERLVENRDGLLAGDLALTGTEFDPRAGYVLLSAGNLYDAAAWQERGADKPEEAELNRQLSLAYNAFGNGLNELHAAGHQLCLASDRRVAAAAPVVASPPSVPRHALLKCAVVGWNRQILTDAAERLRHLGGVPIDVQGTVVRGNFREELDQTWIAMETVQVDGLAINLNYNDQGHGSRNVDDLYRWITDTAN